MKRNIYLKNPRYLLLKAESLNLCPKKLSQRHKCLEFIFYVESQIILSGRMTLHSQGAFINVCSQDVLWLHCCLERISNTRISHMILLTPSSASPGAEDSPAQCSRTDRGNSWCWGFNAARCLGCQGWNSSLHWIQSFPQDFCLKFTLERLIQLLFIFPSNLPAFSTTAVPRA